MNEQKTRKQLPPLRGGVHLLIGPMKSGKTQQLVCKLHRHRIAGHRVVALKWAKDVRSERDRAGLLSSRDGSEPFQAIFIETLRDYPLDGVTNSVIGVDEAQFYDAAELASFCDTAARAGNVVFVAALSSDSERRKWAAVAELVPLVDSVESFCAICERCGDEAPFTMRVGGSRERIAVDAVYEPACRACWRSFENG